MAVLQFTAFCGVFAGLMGSPNTWGRLILGISIGFGPSGLRIQSTRPSPSKACLERHRFRV